MVGLGYPVEGSIVGWQIGLLGNPQVSGESSMVVDGVVRCRWDVSARGKLNF